MRYIAGERLEAGDPARIDDDGTVRRMRRDPHAGEVVLDGGPADRTVFRPSMPFEVIRLVVDGHRSGPPDGIAEYIRTDRRDDEGRAVYAHRRQRYSADGGTREAT